MENKVIFESKESLLNFLVDIGFLTHGDWTRHPILRKAKKLGYIRKSDLELLIEEVETLWDSYTNSKPNCSQSVYDFQTKIINKLYDTFSAIKTELNKRGDI